jgi:hypothetical protein
MFGELSCSFGPHNFVLIHKFVAIERSLTQKKTYPKKSEPNEDRRCLHETYYAVKSFPRGGSRALECAT